MQIFPLSKTFPSRGERDLRHKTLGVFWWFFVGILVCGWGVVVVVVVFFSIGMMLRVSIEAHGIWTLLDPGKMCHYCLDLSFSSAMLLTGLLPTTPWKQRLNYKKTVLFTTRICLIEHSTLWCLVFTKRPAKNCSSTWYYSRSICLRAVCNSLSF